MDDRIDALARCIEIQIERNRRALETGPHFEEGARARQRNAITSVEDLV